MTTYYNLNFFLLFAASARITCIVFLSVFFSFPLISQEKKDLDKNSIIEKRIELIAEDAEQEDIDFTTLFDELSLYFENPLDLNKAGKDQLQALSLLSEIQINNLLNHISKNGHLIAIYELQAIDGFDLETIYNILPFVKVSADFNAPKVSFREMLKYSNSEFVFRETRMIEQMKGFSPIEDSLLLANPNSRYLGSPDKLFTRFRFKYRNNISIGLTAEKDAGEEFFKGSQPNGFDFYSMHFFLKGWGNLKHFVAGDYVLQFGQGLSFWSTRAMNKSADAISIKKNAAIIKPFTSVNENSVNDLFLRGSAATYSIKKIDITGFYSRNYFDASVSEIDSTTGEIVSFSGSASPGLHRTPREMETKNNVAMVLYGSHAAFKGKRLELGVTAVHAGFSASYQPSTKLYNQFAYEGNSSQRTIFGSDYSYIIRNFNFFGEVSRSQNGGMAQIHSALMSLDPRLSFIASYRKYERNFLPIVSNSFRAGYSSNEEGFYAGVLTWITPQLSLSGFIDKFKFAWLTSSADAPSQGIYYFSQLTYKPTKTMEFYGRYRYQAREKSVEIPNSNYDQLATTGRHDVRLHASYKMTDAIKLRTRLELVNIDWWDSRKEKGYLVYQDFVYSPMISPVDITLRYAIFDTESFSSAIWAYENDVLYAFFTRAYYRRGSRAYVILHYNILKNLDIWLRWSQWYITTPDIKMGSGLDFTEGNTNSEMKVQLRYKF